jgi:hypothetical protein
VDEWSADWVSRVLAPLRPEEVMALIDSLRSKLAETSAPSLAQDPFAGDSDLEQRLKSSAAYLSPAARDGWLLLAREVAVAAEYA